jgi:hypothetical protein
MYVVMDIVIGLPRIDVSNKLPTMPLQRAFPYWHDIADTPTIIEGQKVLISPSQLQTEVSMRVLTPP